MARSLLALLVALASLAVAPRTAAADECMCAIELMIAESQGWLDEGEPAEVEPARTPSIIESPDPIAAALDRERALLARERLRELRAQPRDRAFLWCTGTDDPRCSPAAPSETAVEQSLEGAMVGLVPVSLVIGPATASSIGLETMHARGPAGTRRSLDRPPRA